MPDPSPSRFVAFRNAFFSGALLLAPLVVTVWAFSRIITLVGETFRPFIFFYLPDAIRERPGLAVVWDILATVIVILLVTLLGVISRAVFGRFFVDMAERLLLGIPAFGKVYTVVRQFVDTFGTQNRTNFNKVVLVEFPRKGTWTLAFLTNRVQGEAQAKVGEEMWTIFVPTTPNPTSGYLLILPARDVIELDMTVGEGMKMVISGGTVIPQSPAAARAK